MTNTSSSAKSINQLRAGVIGTGFIGPVHIEALRRLGVTVAALCDIPELVHSMAAKHAIPQTFTDYRQLLASPGIDVVHITAPNRFHKEMSIAALQAGKHCVCEKPLAMDTRETAQIAKLAKSSGTIFAVNYNVRFYPAVLQLRQLVAQGGLGEIIHLNGSFILGAKIGSVFATLDTFHKTRQRPLGEVQTFSKASAAMRYASYKVQTEDFASVLLRFDNGAFGNLAVSQVAAGRKNCLRIEIYGSKKSAWWCSEEPEMLRFGNRDTANEVALRATPAFGTGAAGYMDFPPGHVEGFPDTFKMGFRNIYSRIVTGGQDEPLHATAEDGHREVAVCEAIMESNRAKAWTKVR